MCIGITEEMNRRLYAKGSRPGSDFSVVFTMSLYVIELKQTLISWPFQNIRL